MLKSLIPCHDSVPATLIVELKMSCQLEVIACVTIFTVSIMIVNPVTDTYHE